MHPRARLHSARHSRTLSIRMLLLGSATNAIRDDRAIGGRLLRVFRCSHRSTDETAVLQPNTPECQAITVHETLVHALPKMRFSRLRLTRPLFPSRTGCAS